MPHTNQALSKTQRLMHGKIPLKQKFILVLGGMLLAFILVEALLRLAGFLVSFSQTRHLFGFILHPPSPMLRMD